MARRLASASADYKLRTSDLGVDVTTGSSTITVTLPPASQCRKEFTYRISKVDSGSGSVTISPSGSETISGRTSVTILRQYQSVDFVSDGSNWVVEGYGGLAIRIGAYGSPVPQQNTGLINIYSLTTDNSGTPFLAFWLMRGTGTANLLGFQMLTENSNTTTGPAAVLNADFLCALEGATSKLAAVVDHTSGMFAARFKVYSSDGATSAASSRIASIWLDAQLIGSNHSADFYNIYSTGGGKAYKAWASFKLPAGESAGWTNLFEFQFAGTQTPIVAAGVYDPVDTVTQSFNLRVDINGTSYGIPLMALV